MVYIKKSELGYWEKTETNTDGSIEVRDDIKISILNARMFYQSNDYDDVEYNVALSEYNKSQAKMYLSNTDYITIQWNDETALGIEHSRSDAEYQDILQKRQDARELIRLSK